jgi:hypothetical protein
MTTAFRLTAIALMFSAVAASSQALAATKHHHHRGHAAYARAVGSEGDGEMTMNAHREKMIRECSGQMNKLVQKDWGVMQNTTFAACMTEHGEAP